MISDERMRIIDDFRNGIPDKYYSVSAHPRKAGEYIVRKRKNPLTYDIERPVKEAIINKSVDVPTNESITCMRKIHWQVLNSLVCTLI